MHKIQKLTIVLTSIIVFIAFTAFTLFNYVFDFNKVRNKIMEDVFIEQFENSYYKDSSPEELAEWYDTTLHFSKPQKFNYTEDNNIKYVAGKFSFPKLYNLTEDVIGDKGKGLDYSDDEAYNNTFKEIYGADIMNQSIKEATGRTFLIYNGAGISAAFNKLYAKPSTKLQAYTYQKIYNASIKQYNRNFLKVMTYLNTTKKAEWTALCNKVLKEIKTNKEFDSKNAYYEAFNKFFPEGNKYRDFIGNSYFMGTIMRRQMDGSMPAILKCLKTVVKDYDPEALKLILGY